MRKPWTQSDIEYLRKHYPHAKTALIAKHLNATINRVYAKANKLGLNKTPEYLAANGMRISSENDIGANTRFKKGHVPANKGLRRPGYAPGRMSETQFKKGKSPHNTCPIGSYRLDKDGTLQQKINNKPGSNSVRWRSVHELVWVDAHGPVPPKHIVVFKPGMRTNILKQITIDRVECISLAENMRRNTIHNYPKELSDLMYLRASITKQINKRQKYENQ